MQKIAVVLGLHTLVQEKDAEIAELREELEALVGVPSRLAELEAQLAGLARRLEAAPESR